MQFHPTAICPPVENGGSLALASEALRGEGAVLIDETGSRFMPAIHPDAELAPRDVVARAVFARTVPKGRVFLDARNAVGPAFAERFPAIHQFCQAGSIDPVTMPIPVVAAAHYHMGGVAVDLRGRTSLPGLWAVGEVAATGLHGANRLASNSLLEAAVGGAWAAKDIIATRRAPRAAPPVFTMPLAVPEDAQSIAALRRLMDKTLGVVRDGTCLAAGLAQMAEMAVTAHGALAERLLLGQLMTLAALRRLESRGGHYRSDYPATDKAQTAPTILTIADLPVPASRQKALR